MPWNGKGPCGWDGLAVLWVVAIELPKPAVSLVLTDRPKGLTKTRQGGVVVVLLVYKQRGKQPGASQKE